LLLELFEELDARYLDLLPAYPVLSKKAQAHMHAARSLTKNFDSATQLFDECAGRATT
jgi:hypothetical protein